MSSSALSPLVAVLVAGGIQVGPAVDYVGRLRALYEEAGDEFDEPYFAAEFEAKADGWFFRALATALNVVIH